MREVAPRDRKKKTKKIPAIARMRWFRVVRFICTAVLRRPIFVFGVRFARAAVSFFAFGSFANSFIVFKPKFGQLA